MDGGEGGGKRKKWDTMTKQITKIINKDEDSKEFKQWIRFLRNVE